MLTHLTIKNYALIEDIEVSFEKGLTVITGETGAGKSILLNALGLVLGNRADLKVARNPEEKCVVEADFFVKPYGLETLFEQHELDYGEHTIIRREILPNGKSRAFVNDTPVTLQQLQVLGDFLIDVHNQNETRNLASEAYQMDLLDTLAGTKDRVVHYQQELQRFKQISSRLEAMEAEKAQALKEQDYHQFLYNELKMAQLAKLDQESLEENFEKLSNVEVIQEQLATSLQMLNDEGFGILEQLQKVKNLMQKLQGFGATYQQTLERLNSVSIELSDIAETLHADAESLESDPQKLQELNDTLQQLYRLQQKHGVQGVEALRQIESNLEKQLENFSLLDDTIARLEAEKASVLTKLKTETAQIHDKRESILPELKNKLEVILKELGLPYAAFQFHLTKTDQFRANGMSSLAILFAANKGEKSGPIEKIASGGEMSRVMLALKSILASYKELPTIIFDEIDTGVSGEIAHRMATILSQMSKRVQLFSITHLPQTAAKGDYHKKVFKEISGSRTKTLIKDLTQDERILEIAQMIGGSSVSDSAITHAKQLLN